MSDRPRPAWTPLLTLAVTLTLPWVTLGQEQTQATDQVTSVSSESPPKLTTTELEAALAAVEADAGIEEEQKANLRTKYRQISDVLQQALDFAAKAAAFQASPETAPKRTAKNRQQLDQLSSLKEATKIDVTGGSAEVRREVEAQHVALQELSDELTRVTDELVKTEGRPVEIGTRLPEAQRELSGIRKQWGPIQDDASAVARAERMQIQAEYTRLANEVEMLRLEQLSQSVREEDLRSRRDLRTLQVANAKASLESLATRLNQVLASDVSRVNSLAQRASEDLPGDSAVQELATEVRLLAEQFGNVVKSLKQVSPARREVQERLEEVTAEYRIVRNELNLGSGGQELAQVLIELARRARLGSLAQQVPISVERARLDWFSVKKKRRGHSQIENHFASHTSEAVQQLVSARREILEKYQVESANLTQALAELQTQKQRYFDVCDEVQTYVTERLFGFEIRSCPPIGLKTLTGIPAGLTWLLRPEHWIEAGNAFESRPIATLAAGLLAVILLMLRPRLIDALEATAGPIRRISTDRYLWTAKALLWTSLLAAPIPILFGLTAWILGNARSPSEWMVGMADGFKHLTSIVMVATFVSEACRPSGLGTVHFGWDEEHVASVTRAVKLFCAVYVPMMVLAGSTSFGEASQYRDSVGRTAFILAHAWAMLVLRWTVNRQKDGAKFQEADSSSRLSALWLHIRLPLLIGTPLVLIAVACIGYLTTAVVLSLGFCATAGIIAVGQILYDMTARHFEIRWRRLALAEALKERRARLAAAAEERPEHATAELLQFDEQEELGLDIEAAGDQTISFLRLFFNLAVFLATYSYWSAVIPLTTLLDAIPVPLTGGLSLLTLFKSIVTGTVTVVAVRNLPGLLELTVLKASSIEAGTRNAIYTLCQYAVIGLGLIAVSNILSLDWAKLGWMAAALSVGLGFGLQEVVANFVCGLIILFERPIRVGDVVTLEGTTGTVTNINMRATTITNWDRQDFVVPNKNLVTGTILNWTLSEPLNRIVIPVGVAYGSDTEQARQILLDVAADHPKVLDDPAPIASFEQFADSSLNLQLRAYLPDMNNRIGTITELHTEIDKRFAAAGIEIAFPQRDVHIRGRREDGWNDTGEEEERSATPWDN